jgi:hypothetical protein
MRVQIIRDIPTPRLEGYDVSHLQRGEVFEVGRSLCEILYAYGYAEPEEGIAVTVAKPTAKDTAPGPRRKRR